MVMQAELVKQSELYTAKQIDEIYERCPNIQANSIRRQSYNMADALHGIDAKGDTINGKTINYQFKHRLNAKSDIAIPARFVMIKSLMPDVLVHYSYDGEKKFPPRYFDLNLKDADVFVWNVGDSPSIIVSSETLYRIFYRHKKFTSNDFSLYANNSLNKTDVPIDISLATIFIPYSKLAAYLYEDFLITTFGYGVYEKAANNLVDLSGLLKINDSVEDEDDI